MRWELIKCIWVKGTCPQDQCLLASVGWGIKASICALLWRVQLVSAYDLPDQHVVVAVMGHQQTDSDYGPGASWEEFTLPVAPWYQGWVLLNYSTGYP